MLFSDHEKATIKQFIFQRIFDIRIESHPDFERMVQTLDLILSLPINAKLEIMDRMGAGLNAIRVQVLRDLETLPFQKQKAFLEYCHEVISELKVFFSSLSADEKVAYVRAQYAGIRIPDVITLIPTTDRTVTSTDLSRRWHSFRDFAKMEPDWSRLVPIRAIPSSEGIEMIGRIFSYDLFLTHNMPEDTKWFICVLTCATILEKNTVKLMEKPTLILNESNSKWQCFRDGDLNRVPVTNYSYAMRDMLDILIHTPAYEQHLPSDAKEEKDFDPSAVNSFPSL